MAEEIKWSYGQTVVIEKDAAPDPVWSYGAVALYYEYEATGEGWTGKILGATNPVKINGIAVSDIAKVNGVS